MMFTLDAYAARSCAVKTHNTFHPGFTRPETVGSTSRLPGNEEFQSAIYRRILDGGSDVVDLRGLHAETSEVQQAACLQEMADGKAIIIGGLLPRDWAGHRSGRPDLLIRSAVGGYSPGVLKYQRVLDPRKDGAEFIYAELDDLTTRLSTTGRRYRWHWRWANAVQLAHLWRLLESVGQAAADGPSGLVIGNDEAALPVACWLDLTEPSCPPAPAQVAALSEGAAAPPVSALDRYAHEFAERVAIAGRAAAADPDDPPLLAPIVCYECSYCPWWPVCRPQLDDDDLSLRINKSPLDSHEIAVLRESGVATVSQLAGIDLDTLLPGYLPRVAHRSGAEDRLRLAQRRSQLLLNGVELERTASEPILLPSAEVEIDIDIETSRDDRVYLWGFWVSEADGGHYQEFSSFTELDEAGELALAAQAMAWLRALVADRESLVFHYSDYEVVRLTRLARTGEEPLVWALDYAKDHFVDLFAVVRRHFFGANGLGLKVVASAGAGFHWRDQDPGGLNSMAWFNEAVHAPSAPARQQAQARVLAYNEDDVRATWQLRRWLRSLDPA